MLAEAQPLIKKLEIKNLTFVPTYAYFKMGLSWPLLF